MKYLYSWIKEYCPTLPANAEELSELFITLGHDVDSLEEYKYPGLIIGEIISIEPHPNADRLTVVQVKIDSTDDYKTIVCGAPNLKPNQKVVVALPGTTLASGDTLTVAKIRGTESFGMMLAGDEIGMNKDHAGLWPIDNSAQVGAPAANYLPKEFIFELKITHNRGDVLSHFGLARDCAAFLKIGPLQYPAIDAENGPSTVDVKFDQFNDDCRAFRLRPVANLTKLATPVWMANRLNLLGQKSHNAPIDITNYVLLDLGQPLHAYDLIKLGESPVFSVRRAHEGETINVLNGETIILSPDALVVANNDLAVAIAGIIGGVSTSVSNKTTGVLFESATFSPESIQLMINRYGIRTDAAYRYARNVDPALSEIALNQATKMLAEFSSGTAEPIITAKSQSLEARTVTVDVDQDINRLLATTLMVSDVKNMLLQLGFTIDSETETTLTVGIPSWRADVAIPQDIAEEASRLSDIKNIKPINFAVSLPTWKRSKFWQSEKIKDSLVGQGWSEIVTYPFTTDLELTAFGGNLSSAIELKIAPLEGKKFMRQSLLPALISTMSKMPDSTVVKLFEINHVYTKTSEEQWLAIGIAGPSQNDQDDAWKNIFELFHLPIGSWMNRIIELTDEQKRAAKLRKQFASVFTVKVDDILAYAKPDSLSVAIPDIDAYHYQPLGKYPVSRRDLATIVSSSIEPDKIINEILAIDPLIVDAELFDTYASPQFGDGNRSLAFRIYYQSTERTLTDNEIDTLHHKIENYIQEQYNGKIR